MSRFAVLWDDGAPEDANPHLCNFGGSGSSGSSTTYQQTNSTPWSGQQPYLSDLFNQAMNAYYTKTPQYYPSSTYQPLTSTQQSLINQIVGYGSGGGSTSLQGANAAIADITGQGTSALSPTSNLGTAYLSNAMLGGANATNPYGGLSSTGQNYLNALMGGQSGAYNPFSGTNAQAQNYYSNMIGGGTLDPWSSPGFQNIVQGTLANVIPATTSGFAAGGRSDSGLASRAASEGATTAIGSLANQYYQQQQQLQQSAAQQAASQYMQQQAAQQQGAQTGLTTGLTEQQLQQQAATQAVQNYLTGQQNVTSAAAVAPSIDAQTSANLTNAYNAASQQQTDLQAQLTDAVNRWNYNQSLPWSMLQQYSNIVGGTGYGGTSTSATQQPTYSNTLSNVASVGSALGSIGIAAAMFA